MLKVFGHLAPDTDSVCSAIVYAWYRNEAFSEAVTPYILGEANKEAKYVLERFGVTMPELLTEMSPEDQYVLVDTNNPDELLDSHKDATLTAIVDHHKLVGGLTTTEPLTVHMAPVACTCTILYGLIEAADLEIPEEIAGLMLAAILSDTMKFTSPTTTPQDRDVAQILAEMTGIDIEELAMAQFAAKSDVSDVVARDLILTDSKKYPIGSNNVRFTCIETTAPEQILSRAVELTEALEELRAEEGLQGLYFFVVDIINSESTLITVASEDAEKAAKAFNVQADERGYFVLPGIISRKKQMIPAIEPQYS